MGVVITFVIFSRYITSQEQQIGMALGYGYSKMDINKYFLTIFLLVTFIAVPLAIGLGYFMGWMILGVLISRVANLELLEVNFMLLPELALYGIALGVLMILLSIFLPLRKIKRKIAAELIYGQKETTVRVKDKKKRQEKKVKKVSRSWVWRNLFRNKKRI